MQTSTKPEKRGARYPASVMLHELQMQQLAEIAEICPGKSNSDIIRDGIGLVWLQCRKVPA